MLKKSLVIFLLFILFMLPGCKKIEETHEHIRYQECGKCTDVNCDGTEDEKCQKHYVDKYLSTSILTLKEQEDIVTSYLRLFYEELYKQELVKGRIVNYYGLYGGAYAVILEVDCDEYTDSLTEDTVADVTIKYNNNNRIVIYYNKDFYTLENGEGAFSQFDEQFFIANNLIITDVSYGNGATTYEVYEVYYKDNEVYVLLKTYLAWGGPDVTYSKNYAFIISKDYETEKVNLIYSN